MRAVLLPRRTIREQVAAERFAQVTERSISDARLAQLTERRQLEAQFGVKFDAFKDGQLQRDRRQR
jgi:hypothetical protein